MVNPNRLQTHCHHLCLDNVGEISDKLILYALVWYILYWKGIWLPVPPFITNQEQKNMCSSRLPLFHEQVP